MIWKLPAMGCCWGGWCCILPLWHFLASEFLLTNKMAASHWILFLGWRPEYLSEKVEIRDWNSNHFCRPKALLSLNLGPLITNLGMIFSGHFTGLVLVKPLWWSCWLFYLVKVSRTNWACSVDWNCCQGQLNGMSNWQQQSKVFSASFPAPSPPPPAPVQPPSLSWPQSNSGQAQAFSLTPFSLLVFKSFFIWPGIGYNAFNFVSMDLHLVSMPP